MGWALRLPPPKKKRSMEIAYSSLSAESWMGFGISRQKKTDQLIINACAWLSRLGLVGATSFLIGTYRFQNGDVYRGEFKGGLFDGKGSLLS